MLAGMKLLALALALVFTAAVSACSHMESPDRGVAGGVGMGTNAEPNSGNDFGSSTSR